MAKAPTRRCLIVERHEWETGAFRHQLQFPLAAAQVFFGPPNADRNVQVRLFIPPDAPVPAVTTDMTISRRYRDSGTRRTNRLRQIGTIPSSFVFFEETGQPNVYDLWWELDKAIVAAHFHPWQQARSSQHGRGRLFAIVAAPVPRPIDHI